MKLTRREVELLFKFDSDKPVQADFDEVQELTSKHLLLMVSDCPCTWVLSNEGQLAKEAETQKCERERREKKAETWDETQAKLGVYGFFISIATLLVSIAGLAFSVWSFYN